MKEVDDIPFDEFFQIAESKGHNSKLKSFLSFKSAHQNSFSVRIVEQWNSLPKDLIFTRTVL